MLKKMKKFIFVIPLMFAVYLSSCVGVQQSETGLPNIVIELSPDKFTQFLKDRFPIEKDVKIGKLVLKNPNVLKIDKNNKLELGTDVVFDSLIDVDGRVDIAGNIYFDRDKKAFYLQNPEIKKLKFFNQDFTPPPIVDTALNSLINMFFKQTPIYQFDKIYQKYLVKDVKVEDGKIKVILGF